MRELLAAAPVVDHAASHVPCGGVEWRRRAREARATVRASASRKSLGGAGRERRRAASRAAALRGARTSSRALRMSALIQSASLRTARVGRGPGLRARRRSVKPAREQRGSRGGVAGDRAPPRPAARSAGPSGRDASRPRSPSCWLPRGNRLTATAARARADQAARRACTTARATRRASGGGTPSSCDEPCVVRSRAAQAVFAVQRANEPSFLELGQAAPVVQLRTGAASLRPTPTSSTRASSVGQPSARAARARLNPSRISSWSACRTPSAR